MDNLFNNIIAIIFVYVCITNKYGNVNNNQLRMICSYLIMLKMKIIFSEQGEFTVLKSKRIEQTAIPLTFTYLPSDLESAQRYLLIAENQVRMLLIRFIKTAEIRNNCF